MIFDCAELMPSFQDSVPAAVTKDKKRLHDQEISVHLAWQSTLYVTNFPEDADDGLVRELFGKVFPRFVKFTNPCSTAHSTAHYSMFVGPARNSKARADSAMCNILRQYVTFTLLAWIQADSSGRIPPKPLLRFMARNSRQECR